RCPRMRRARHKPMLRHPSINIADSMNHFRVLGKEMRNNLPSISQRESMKRVLFPSEESNNGLRFAVKIGIIPFCYFSMADRVMLRIHGHSWYSLHGKNILLWCNGMKEAPAERSERTVLELVQR